MAKDEIISSFIPQAAGTGFPFTGSVALALGLGGLLFGDSPEEEAKKKLLQLSKEGVDVGKLIAPELGAINTTFSQGLTDRMKNIFSQGLGGSGVVEDAPLSFAEAKSGAIGQAFARGRAENERIKSNALTTLAGGSGGGQVFGQAAGFGLSNIIKNLLANRN